MSSVITPTVGRKVWFRPNGATNLQIPWSAISEMITVVSPDQPLDATVVYVWHDRLVNLFILDQYGNQFVAQRVQLLQPGETAPDSCYYAEWMPYQVQAAVKEKPVAQDDHASGVLYPAISRAMGLLSQIPAGQNGVVDAAYNELYDAFWSQTPPPASAPARR